MNSRIKSFRDALNGILSAFKTEINFRIEVVIMLAAAGLAFYLKFSNMEWSILVICIGLVFITEILNTALEKLGDRISLEKDSQIGLIKDLGAGAVLLSAILSVIIGLLLYLPKLTALLTT